MLQIFLERRRWWYHRGKKRCGFRVLVVSASIPAVDRKSLGICHFSICLRWRWFVAVGRRRVQWPRTFSESQCKNEVVRPFSELSTGTSMSLLRARWCRSVASPAFRHRWLRGRIAWTVSLFDWKVRFDADDADDVFNLLGPLWIRSKAAYCARRNSRKRAFSLGCRDVMPAMMCPYSRVVAFTVFLRGGGGIVNPMRAHRSRAAPGYPG